MTQFNAAFWKWFGKSVVTVTGKPGGEPLVVYHGTASEDFCVFEGTEGAGWFAESKDSARAFGPNVRAFYLKIEHPFDPDRDPRHAQLAKQMDAEIDAEYGDDPDRYEARLRAYSTWLVARGFDGIVGGDELGDARMRSFNVFSPTQIKSVDNLGTWDPEDPDIRHNPGYAIALRDGSVITPSARRRGRVQVTSFTPDGVPSGHEEHDSLAEAIASHFCDLDHPLAQLMSRREAVRAWEEATFEHPYRDKLADMPYAYVSPLRPLSGVAVEGDTSWDKSGRVGVLYRSEPLPISKMLSLSLVPVTPAAITALATELANAEE